MAASLACVITMRLAFLASVLLVGSSALAEIPDRDLRNVEIRHTDMVYSLPDYTADEWKQRADFLRKQILFSAGLLPMPAKSPLGPLAGDVIEHEDYSVASVLLETYPGYYLGGNLYRPVDKSGPFPAVVSPHGHWRYGRFENSELNSVPGRAISLARQGYVVFAYDMVGWNDTMQTPHGFAGPREELWVFRFARLAVVEQHPSGGLLGVAAGCGCRPHRSDRGLWRRHPGIPAGSR